MAITDKYKITESQEIQTYIKISNLIPKNESERSVEPVKDEEGNIIFRKLVFGEKKLFAIYHVAILSEKGGKIIQTETGKFYYQGGDIWKEAYAHLKLKYPNAIDC